jgi:hypothetical protein
MNCPNDRITNWALLIAHSLVILVCKIGHYTGMPQPPPFSPTLLATLVLICAASVAMFFLLVRRWTTQRQWVSLAEWARQRRFRFEPVEHVELPRALLRLRERHNVNVRLHLRDQQDHVTLLQLQTDRLATSQPPAASIEPHVQATETNRWNVLLRRTVSKRDPDSLAGLRPASAPASLLDLLALSQFPSLSLGHRFVVLATRSAAARALANSASRTLLPADVGLLVMDGWMLLDFSTRPFDPVELDRMIALAEQIGQMT